MGGNKRPERRIERRPEPRVEPRVEQVGDVEVLIEEPSAAAAAGFGQLSKLLGEQAVKCMLRRRDEDTKKWDFQDTFPVEDFSFEMVRDVFGGGEYQVQAMDESGDFMKSFTFNIDRRYKGKRWMEQHGMPVPAAGGDAGATWIASALDKLGEAVKELKEVKAAPAPAAPDPMAMIEKLASTMRALTPPPPPAPAAPPAPPGLKEQLEMIKSVVEVGTTIIDARGGGGGGDTGDVYMGAVTKLAEPIIDLVKQRAEIEAGRARRALPPGNRNAVTPPRLVPTPATTTAAPNPPSTGAQPMALGWVAEIQKWVPMIVTRARKGLSAEDTAFFILDELSDMTQKKLAEMAAREDFAEQVGPILPQELAQYPEWVTEFLAAVQDYLFGGDDDITGVGGDEDETPPEQPVRDLDAEARAKIDALEDNPEKLEPVPTS